MDPHMHHIRPSSDLHFKFGATKKIMEEEETDMEEEEEEEEEEEMVEEQEKGSGGFGGRVEEEPQLKKKIMDFGRGSRKRGPTTAAAAEGAGGGGVAPPPSSPPLSCRAEKCNADLSGSKRYHRRHKVCEHHAKAEVVLVDGLKQRFCQQCSRFHELSEFDEAKRSCRRRLAGHNERRRKHFSESRGVASRRRGSSPGIKKNQCRQADEPGRNLIVFPENHQNFHIH